MKTGRGPENAHAALILAAFVLSSLLLLCSCGAGAAAAGCTERVSWPDLKGSGAEISFSRDSGIYSEKSFNLSIKASSGYTIAYTTDGTLPSKDDDSGRSTVSVSVKSGGSDYLVSHRDLMLLPDFGQKGLYSDKGLPGGTVLTAALFDKTGRMSETVTKVYFPGLEPEKSFPGCIIFSVVTDPVNLLDYNTGILAYGAVYDEWKDTEDGRKQIERGARWDAVSNSTQHGKDWERPALIQIYDKSSIPSAECGAGLRVSGGSTRTKVQKPFSLYFRKSYGPKHLKYTLFDGISSYDSISLKTGGDTTEYFKYKILLIRNLTDGRDFLIPFSRPAVLFLNGEYWGPYILQEKISPYMLKTRFGVDDDQVVIIKDGLLEDGTDADYDLYKELMSYAEKDLSDPEIYAEFCGLMDVSSMADYFAVQVYIGNPDFEQYWNDLMWRTRDDSYNRGRWQYILYDIEYSAGLYGKEKTSPTTDHFTMIAEKYPLFAAALKNREFFGLFLKSVKDIGSQNFSPDRVLREIDALKAVWDPLMPDFYKRYGNTSQKEKQEVERLVRFFEERYDFMIPLLEEWQENNF